MKKYTLLFWGSVWGICEASFGFVLHRAAIALPGLPGALMFPIGFFCMVAAQRATGLRAAPFLAAVVAASIKSVNFILPGMDPIRVVNPALSILLEGLAVTALSIPQPAQSSPKFVLKFIRVLCVGIVWRAMFAAYLSIISLFALPAALVTSGVRTLLRFVLMESFINSVIISLLLLLLLRAVPARPFKNIRVISPVAAVTVTVIAVSLELLL